MCKTKGEELQERQKQIQILLFRTIVANAYYMLIISWFLLLPLLYR